VNTPYNYITRAVHFLLKSLGIKLYNAFLTPHLIYGVQPAYCYVQELYYIPMNI